MIPYTARRIRRLDVVDALRRTWKASGLSQHDFAAAHFTRQGRTFRRWLDGSSTPPASVAAKLIAMGCFRDRIKAMRVADAANSQKRQRRLSSARQRGSHSAQDWKAMCEAYDNRCLCCGSRKTVGRDHVVPIYDGGSDTIQNLQLLCRQCNGRKGPHRWDFRLGRAHTQISWLPLSARRYHIWLLYGNS